MFTTRSVRGLMPILLILLLGSFGLELSGRQTMVRADQPSISFSILNARTGLLHITATGLPVQEPLILVITLAPVAAPMSMGQYMERTTTATGTLDFTDPVGLFMCGTNVQIGVEVVTAPVYAAVPTQGTFQFSDVDPVVQSPVEQGQCAAGNPAVGIVNLANGAAIVTGQGFYPQEALIITVTSSLTGTVGIVASQADVNGAFTVSVPVGTPTCGDRLSTSVSGGAGSLAVSGAFTYTCLVQVMPTPTPTPRVFTSSAPGPQVAHLTVSASPRSVLPHHLETIHVETGVPYALVRAVFSGQGLQTVAFYRRADNVGSVRIIYMAPTSLPATRVLVQYTISYSVGRRPYQSFGSFVLSQN